MMKTATASSMGTDGTLKIAPEDINAKKHLFESFDNMETEISAGWLVRFAQARGQGWAPFTLAEIEAFYHRKYPRESFEFNRLVDPQEVFDNPAQAFSVMMGATGRTPAEKAIHAMVESSMLPKKKVGGGWIIKAGGKYHFTADFVMRCWNSSSGVKS